MSQHEVRQFIVVAPAMLGKAVEWAEPMLLEHLAGRFPGLHFQIEPYGPFADDDEFTVIPIMSRPPDAGESTRDDTLHLAELDPAIIPEIRQALRSFDPAQQKVH